MSVLLPQRSLPATTWWVTWHSPAGGGRSYRRGSTPGPTPDRRHPASWTARAYRRGSDPRPIVDDTQRRCLPGPLQASMQTPCCDCCLPLRVTGERLTTAGARLPGDPAQTTGLADKHCHEPHNCNAKRPTMPTNKKQHEGPCVPTASCHGVLPSPPVSRFLGLVPSAWTILEHSPRAVGADAQLARWVLDYSLAPCG